MSDSTTIKKTVEFSKGAKVKLIKAAKAKHLKLKPYLDLIIDEHVKQL